MARMGRPPIDPAVRRSERFTLRFTRGELRDLKRRAAEAGMPLGMFLRSLIKKGLGGGRRRT